MRGVIILTWWSILGVGGVDGQVLGFSFVWVVSLRRIILRLCVVFSFIF